MDFLKRQFLPVGLVVCAGLGLVLPAPGQYMARLPTQQVAVSVIFICSGLMLRTEEIRAAFSAWPATIWGTVAVLLLTPIIGTVLAFQLPMDPYFQLGLALFCCMPTTLSSGIALTNQARGNVALALLLTVLTNTLGIFTVPFVLQQLLKSLGQVELSAVDLLVKMCYSILLPLALGRYLQRFVAGWVQHHRTHLVLLSNAALITIPWMKFSESAEKLGQLALGSLAVVVLGGMLVHLLFLLLNYGASRLLRFPPQVRTAVVLVASQKTLPVAMTVLAFLPLPAQVKGLVAIPCVILHLGQIFFDAFVATHWRNAAV